MRATDVPSRASVPVEPKGFRLQGNGGGRHQFDMLAGSTFLQLVAKPSRQIARMSRLCVFTRIHFAYSLLPRDRQDWGALGAAGDSREFPLSKTTYLETSIEIAAKPLDTGARIFKNGV